MAGEPMPGKEPPSYHKYVPYKKGFDKRGGGAIILCKYILEVKIEKLDLVNQMFKEYIKDNGICEKIEIEDLCESCV